MQQGKKFLKMRDCDTTVDEVKQFQKNDETLASWWQKSVELKDSEQVIGTVFVVKNELLWRKKTGRKKHYYSVSRPKRVTRKAFTIGSRLYSKWYQENIRKHNCKFLLAWST